MMLRQAQADQMVLECDTRPKEVIQRMQDSRMLVYS